MPEENTSSSSQRGKSRRERVEYARSRDILDVANELHMELVRDGKDYRWKEHDSLVITPSTNLFNWFSRSQGGDSIALVEMIKEVNFNQALDFLNDGNFKEFTAMRPMQELFHYYLAPYEQPFEAGRRYLKEQRGLSDDTIDFFLKQGVIAQANAKVNGSIETVIVFKSFDFSGELVGATLQGIEENWEKWPKRGYAKKIVNNSDGITGMHVDIGQPNRLVFTESAIDLMSYYELHKDKLQDVRLVSMDGVKEAMVGRHLAQLQSEFSGRPLRWSHEQLADGLQVAIDKNFFTEGKHADWITLAVDNDEGGRNFIKSLREKGATVTVDLPALPAGKEKMDWNDALKNQSVESTVIKVVSASTSIYEGYDVLMTDQREVLLGKTENYDNNGSYNNSDDTLVTVSQNEKMFYMLQDGELTRSKEELLAEGVRSHEDYQELERLKTGRLSQLIEKHLHSQHEVNVSQQSLEVSRKESSEDTKKALEEIPEQQKNERTIQRKGSLQPEAEGSTSPVSEADTFDRSVTSRPTKSSHYLNITIKNGFKSRKTRFEKSINRNDLDKLNRFSDNLQEAAQYYKNELANAKIIYFTVDGNVVEVNFPEQNFMHLTGLKVVGDNQSPEKTLNDLAIGGEVAFDDIRISNTDSAFDKIKVLPELKVVLQTNSFYFDHLEDIPRYTGRFDSIIKADDRDIMLLFRADTEDGTVPVSLFKSRVILEKELLDANKNEILGIYRERDGIVEQISVNDDYIKDGGAEMLSILKNKQYEDVSREENQETEPRFSLEPNQPEEGGVIPQAIAAADVTNNPINSEIPEREMTPEMFTQVLDAVYNVGAPQDLSTVPEEFHSAWNRYFELSKASQGDFKQVIAQAAQSDLLLPESPFYKEWRQDQVYNENYHVRLQWAENMWSEQFGDNPFSSLPSDELIDYREFVTQLYQRNQQLMATEEIGYEKVKFDLYGPGGRLIKQDLRYDAGSETTPVSQGLGLGYRRIEGWKDLSEIDAAVLSQLENQELNQELSKEANEQTLSSQEFAQEESKVRDDFHSRKTEMKSQLAKRVEEIVAEDSAKHKQQESVQQPQKAMTAEEAFDYKTASAYEISERAFQKIREFTQSPEDLMEYLDFMSKFPQLSPRNVALIQEQWRGANAVATYDQWKSMGEALGIKKEDVIQTKATYTNKRTGETKEVVHQGLSVKTGEKSQITLFRPVMVRMIPVVDENGNHVKNDKGNPKYKKLSEATPQEKALVKDGKLSVRQFQKRDPRTGQPRFTTYKVFELSQTTLKLESYPKAMPNRHYNFDTDKVKTKEVLEGLCDYAESIGVSMMKDEAHVLGNAKGAFFPEEQLILINPDNTSGEKIATTIHELAHATLHNPNLSDQYKELPKVQKELEAEMTSHLLSKHFGLDTSEKAINYIAKWTDNLQGLDDKQLAASLKRIHKTVSKMHKQIESHIKPYQLGKTRGQNPNFSKAPINGPSR